MLTKVWCSKDGEAKERQSQNGKQCVCMLCAYVFRCVSEVYPIKSEQYAVPFQLPVFGSHANLPDRSHLFLSHSLALLHCFFFYFDCMTFSGAFNFNCVKVAIITCNGNGKMAQCYAQCTMHCIHKCKIHRKFPKFLRAKQ